MLGRHRVSGLIHRRANKDVLGDFSQVFYSLCMLITNTTCTWSFTVAKLL